MANLFALSNNEDEIQPSMKINLDDLYEKKRQSDIAELNIYKRLLNRVHIRIKTASRGRVNNKHCWYVVPEAIIGVTRYEQASAIAYVMNKLKDNGFEVRFINPNVLFISWYNWIPKYVRTEIKKNMGVAIDGFGNKIKEKSEDGNEEDDMSIKSMLGKKLGSNASSSSASDKNKSNIAFKNISNYKPTGNFTYNTKMLTDLTSKLN